MLRHWTKVRATESTRGSSNATSARRGQGTAGGLAGWTALVVGLTTLAACGPSAELVPEDEALAERVADEVGAATRAATHRWNGGDPKLLHQIGRPFGDAWQVDAGSAAGRFINYGPYVAMPAGSQWRVRFAVARTSAADAPNEPVIELDVFDLHSSRRLARRTLWLEELPFRRVQRFDLTFQAAPGTVLEFRSQLLSSRLGVRLVSIELAPANEGLVGAWYKGQLQPTQVANLPAHAGWFVVHQGTWYHFNREIMPATVTPTMCRLGGPNPTAIATVVRTSRDQGRTWSTHSRVIAPSFVATDPDACTIVDGTTFYNDERRTWQTLAQCLGPQGSPWRMCLYEAPSIDGAYRRIRSYEAGSLWDRICSEAPGTCGPARVVDEGTPEFLGKRHGAYYFSFHGYDGVRGFRGVARTRDFVSWDTRGAGMPTGPIYTANDCSSIPYPGTSDRCIGAGAAAHIESGDFEYLLIEAPTKNLACQEGQYWPFLLHRSHQLEGTGRWQSSPRNPLLRPTVIEPCALQYAKFIRDGSRLYVGHFRKTGAGRFDSPLLYLGEDPAPVEPPSEPLPPDPGFTPRTFRPEVDLRHQIGRRSATGNSWYVTHLDPSGRYLNFGPYVSGLPPGRYEARFVLRIDHVRRFPSGGSIPNQHLLTLDVASKTGSVVHRRLEVQRHDFQGDMAYTTFPLRFDVGSSADAYEFRSFFRGHSYVELARIELSKID